MKLIPRRDQIIGRVVIKRVASVIVRPEESKGTSKFVLVDAVGPEAALKGIKVGDVVLAKKMHHIMLDGGSIFRPLVDEPDVASFLTETEPGELAIQVDSGQRYVSFDDPDAAASLADSPMSTETEKAA